MKTTIKLTIALALAAVSLMSVVAVATPIQEISADTETSIEFMRGYHATKTIPGKLWML